MKLTVYIPCFNAAETLRPVLEAILAQRRSADEILLIDDGSTDESANIADAFTSHGVRLHRQPCNRGLAAARNVALCKATGDVLVGVDADVVIRSDYLAKVEKTFMDRPDLGAICGRLIERHVHSPADRWRSVHMRQDDGTHSSDYPKILYGCTTSIKREVAQSIGGWNERFNSTHEDVDLTERLGQAEVPIRFESECVAEHLKQDTPASVLTGFWRWFFPAGELAGHFSSPEVWARERIEPVQWSIFHDRVAKDIQHRRDELLPLTLLLPWWMTALDLVELGRRFDHRRAELNRVLISLIPILCDTIGNAPGSTDLQSWMSTMLSNGLEQATKRQKVTPTPFVESTEQILRHAATSAYSSKRDMISRAAVALEHFPFLCSEPRASARAVSRCSMRREG